MANKDEIFCGRSEFIEVIKKLLKQPELLVIIPPEVKEETKGGEGKQKAGRGNEKQKGAKEVKGEEKQEKKDSKKKEKKEEKKEEKKDEKKEDKKEEPTTNVNK